MTPSAALAACASIVSVPAVDVSTGCRACPDAGRGFTERFAATCVPVLMPEQNMALLRGRFGGDEWWARCGCEHAALVGAVLRRATATKAALSVEHLALLLRVARTRFGSLDHTSLLVDEVVSRLADAADAGATTARVDAAAAAALARLLPARAAPLSGKGAARLEAAVLAALDEVLPTLPAAARARVREAAAPWRDAQLRALASAAVSGAAPSDPLPAAVASVLAADEQDQGDVTTSRTPDEARLMTAVQRLADRLVDTPADERARGHAIAALCASCIRTSEEATAVATMLVALAHAHRSASLSGGQRAALRPVLSAHSLIVEAARELLDGGSRIAAALPAAFATLLDEPRRNP